MEKERLLQALSLIGVVFNGVEAILTVMGKSMCSTMGCTINHAFDRYGILPLVGALFYLSTFLLSTAFKKEEARKYLYFIFSAGLACEGFLIGFQLFYTRVFCAYCLLNAYMVVVLFTVFVWVYEVKGFEAMQPIGLFCAVVFMTFLVRAPLYPVIGEGKTIIYGKGCPHCRALMEKARKQGIGFRKVDVREALSLVSQLGIKGVPVVVRKEGEKFVIGVGEKEGWKVLKKDRQNQEDRKKSHPLPFLNGEVTSGFSTDSLKKGSENSGMCTIGGNCEN